MTYDDVLASLRHTEFQVSARPPYHLSKISLGMLLDIYMHLAQVRLGDLERLRRDLRGVGPLSDRHRKILNDEEALTNELGDEAARAIKLVAAATFPMSAHNDN